MKRIIIITFVCFTFFCNAQNSSKSIESELEKLHIQTTKKRDSLLVLIQGCNQKMKATVDPITVDYLKLVVDSLYNISDRNDIDELKINLEYAKKHPSSLYCLEVVQQQIARQPGKNFYNDFEEIYLNASKEVKESDSGKKMSEQLKYFKQSKRGSTAPNFRGKDNSDKEIALSDYIGKKYILIDFWASWCAPCREELGYLKELYTKYQDRGFEIISISIDEDPAAWQKTIIKEAIENWKHYSTTQNNSTAKRDYFVNGIPHKVLIDKNGIIIGKWKGGGELNKKSLQNQLLEIFK